MNRDDLKDLTRTRLKEARVLLQTGNYPGAYCLCGYAVECGLKACIAKQTRRYDFPDRRIVNQSYTHDSEGLARVAGLWPLLQEQMRSTPDFEQSWVVVKDWSEGSRYDRASRQEAQDLYSAITGREYGVLRWIRQHW